MQTLRTNKTKCLVGTSFSIPFVRLMPQIYEVNILEAIFIRPAVANTDPNLWYNISYTTI